jgi:hypothetical protein
MNRRWIVALDGGKSAFVKLAATDEGADWLRNERTVYRALNGVPFLPRLIGWHDDGERPALAIEDLSGAEWPPPWTPARIDTVRASLAQVAETPPPAALPSASQSQFDLNGWPEIATDPGPLLGLRMCSAAWLERALPVLDQRDGRRPIRSCLRRVPSRRCWPATSAPTRPGLPFRSLRTCDPCSSPRRGPRCRGPLARSAFQCRSTRQFEGAVDRPGWPPTTPSREPFCRCKALLHSRG